MSFYLVFTGNDIRPNHLALIQGYLDENVIRFNPSPRWLNPHRAVEIYTEDKPLPAQFAGLKSLLAPYKIDAFVTPAHNRRKKLMLADMDATIVKTETLDELAFHAGIGDEIAQITKRAMAGELDFEQALNERVLKLKDLNQSVLAQTLEETELSEGAKTLVRVLSAFGTTCVLVSGGFTYFTKIIAERCGFHFNHGNHLEIENGVLTGRVTPPILDKSAKLQFLRDYADKKSITSADVFAIGDGANDLPMLEEAGLGIGYQPKPLVAERIENTIIYSDLTAALYIQGFAIEDIEKGLRATEKPHYH